MISGIFIGIILTLISVVSGVLISLKFGKQVERYVEQKKSAFKSKGVVIEPEHEPLVNWLKDIEKNEDQTA